MKHKSYRDLMYAIANRAKALSNMKVLNLRLIAGYGCETESEAKEKNRYKDKGTLIEEILTEEFDIETDMEFENND